MAETLDKKIDDLASAVANGFTEVAEAFQKVDERFDKMEGKQDRQFEHLLGAIHTVNEDLAKRVKILEEKVFANH